MDRTLSNATALISGGASGLGFATAEHVVARGGRVVLLDVNQEKGDNAARKLGQNAIFLATDITQESQVDAAVNKAMEKFARIDLLVNCAGIAPSRRVLARDGLMATDDFERVIRINLVGVFCVARAAANVMQNNAPDVAGQRGVIIQTASIAAFDGQIGQAAYSASKAGIVGMTLPLAREFARLGIRVVTIAPGLFRTPMFDTLPPKAVEELEASTPFPKRLGKPEEFAALVEQIYVNTMINGETVRIDGALRM